MCMYIHTHYTPVLYQTENVYFKFLFAFMKILVDAFSIFGLKFLFKPTITYGMYVDEHIFYVLQFMQCTGHICSEK